MASAATETPTSTITAEYSNYVNPQWVRLLKLLEMDVSYRRCLGTELFTDDGRVILDFLSGYCVHNIGHNHPGVISAIKSELDRNGPAMLQSHVPDLAGTLAKRLCVLGGGKLQKAFFACSGSEGIEAAIKFSRKHTGRTGLLYADGAFHGLTCGALSLMGDAFWRDKFGPMLPGAEAVPFDDIDALSQRLATGKFAAFIVEPLQSEAGIRIPSADYFERVEELCRRHGTLLVLDEVQTGMYRTGPFLCAHQLNVRPDMVVMAKALSGGLVPCSAVLMSDEVYGSVYDSLKRSIVHTSTFGENSLAMRTALATLDVLGEEGLGARATARGEYLRDRLRQRLSGFNMVADIRGLGLLSGIEFRPPSAIRLRIPFEAFRAIHPGMFGQVVVMRMFRDWNILTQMCGNNFLVLKVAPPLVVSEPEIDRFVEAVGEVVEKMHTSTNFWTEALSLGRRAVNV